MNNVDKFKTNLYNRLSEINVDKSFVLNNITNFSRLPLIDNIKSVSNKISNQQLSPLNASFEYTSYYSERLYDLFKNEVFKSIFDDIKLDNNYSIDLVNKHDNSMNKIYQFIKSCGFNYIIIPSGICDVINMDTEFKMIDVHSARYDSDMFYLLGKYRDISIYIDRNVPYDKKEYIAGCSNTELNYSTTLHINDVYEYEYINTTINFKYSDIKKHFVRGNLFTEVNAEYRNMKLSKIL